MPLLPDDYLQIELGRNFISSDGWTALLQDPLYRCRATSLLLTRLTDLVFGVSAAAMNVSSVLVHALNTLLVYLLGRSPLIGFRVSAAAAFVFAIRERHHEAVVWYAALPELLVFTFVLASLLCWIEWLHTGQERWYAGCLVTVALALASKESGVIAGPLLALFAFVTRAPARRWLWRLGPPALLVFSYMLLSFQGREANQHFGDGTFSLSAPFPETFLRSAGRAFWVWGTVAAAILVWTARIRRSLLWLALGWIALALAPYCFLTYMPRIPSRHHYLASLGVALLAGAAFVALRESVRRSGILVAMAALFVAHNFAYLLLVKRPQFLERAAPIERLIDFARQQDGPVSIGCVTVSPDEARRAVRLRISEAKYSEDGTPFHDAGCEPD